MSGPPDHIPGGWIKLYRCIQGNPLWQERPFDRGRAWVDLILLANHRDGYLHKRGIKIDVKRGQVGWSERALAERWGWSRGKVTRFLHELKMEQQIEQQNGPQNINVTSLITITNYEKYQSDEPQNGPQNEPQTGRKQYHRQECKEDKNKISSPAKNPPVGSRLFSDWFCYAFERCQGYPYAFESGKDGKALSELLKTWPCKELVAKACHFLTDEDRFPKSKAPTLTFFKSKINDYPNHINGKADHFRELGLLPPDGVLLEDWRPWQ